MFTCSWEAEKSGAARRELGSVLLKMAWLSDVKEDCFGSVVVGSVQSCCVVCCKKCDNVLSSAATQKNDIRFRQYFGGCFSSVRVRAHQISSPCSVMQ